MSVTVKVNGTNNSLVHKGSTGISTATIPDVCKTPSPGGPVPLPYPNIAMSSDLAKGTTTVKADGGQMIAIKGSEFARSTGDEPGTAGGVTSSTFIKEATWILYSFDVKMDGKNACRLTDKMFHNHKNTVNMAGVVQYPLGVGTTEDDLRELAERCNRKVNEDHGLCPASSRPAGRPTGKECTRLGDEKHKCCEKSIKKAQSEGKLGNMRSEQAYNSKNQPIDLKSKVDPRTVAKRAYTRFINKHAPSAKGVANPTGATKAALTRAKRMAKEQGIYKKALFKAGKGQAFRADVLVVDPPGASPVKPNVKEAYDFKFSCEANDDVRPGQQQQYRNCTGIPAKAIHHQGTKC